MLKNNIFETVSQYSLLDGLAPHKVKDFIKNGRLQQYKQGTYMFHQGEPADRYAILISGQVKLTQITPAGKQVILHYFGPGDGVGIIAVLGDMMYPGSAYVTEACESLSWSKEMTEQLMLRYPCLALNGIEIVAKRFAILQDRYQEISTQLVERRVAMTLLRLAHQFGRRIDEGIFVDMPLSRQDLGEMVGTNLYNVSRILRKWEKCGYVSIGRQRVVLCNPHAIVMISEGKE